MSSTEWAGEVQMCVIHHHCGWCGEITEHYCKDATKLRKTRAIVVPDMVNEEGEGEDG